MDSGTRFRCIVYSPGASATSDVATVTVTVPLYFARTAPDTLRLSWPLPPPPMAPTSFVLEQTPTLSPASWGPAPVTYNTTAASVYATVTVSQAGPGMLYRLHKP